MNSAKKEEQPMAWLGLYSQCMRAIKLSEKKSVYASWLMAIAFKESNASAYFQPADLVYNANLMALPMNTELERNMWVDWIRVQGGPYKGQIPKFRYEVSWAKRFQKLLTKKQALPSSVLVKCCSWGIAQKSGLYLLSSQAEDDQLPLWRQFCADPLMQLMVLVDDLSMCIVSAKGDLKIAFSQYNAGPGCMVPTNYGTVAYNLADGFSQEIAKYGYPQQ